MFSLLVKNWGNAKQKMNDLIQSLNGRDEFKFDKDFLLKAGLFLFDVTDITFSNNNLVKEIHLFDDNWDKFETAIKWAVNLITEEWRFTPKMISSYNAIIPIAYYYYKLLGNNNKPKNINKEPIKRWFVISLIKKIFGGHSDSLLKDLRDVIKDNKKNDFPFDEIVKKFKGKDKDITIDKDDIKIILNYEYGKDTTYIYLIMFLLYPKFDFSYKWDIDHLYPQNLKVYSDEESYDKDLYKDLINIFANLQPLNPPSNKAKSNIKFEEWLEDYLTKDKDYLQDFYIPVLDNYKIESFEKFIEERTKLLEKKLKEILK